MAVKFDSILGKLRQKDVIPQMDADPSSPKQEDAWVLHTNTGGNDAGNPIGLLLGLTYSELAGGTDTYELKYRTKEDTTVAVSLT